MNILKKIAKSKTMLFSLALAVLGVLETQIHLLQDAIPKPYFGLVVVAISAAVAALRVLTTTSLSEK